MAKSAKPMLTMIWPVERLRSRIDPLTPEGYSIRQYRPGDASEFLRLMECGEFDPWDEEKLAYNVARAIPEGWFVAVESDSDEVVATAMCLHNYTGRRPFSGDVGWVSCDPSHRGHGLGYSLTAHVTNRFLDAGYRLIYLGTEHYRFAAVKTYFKVGYVPLIESDELAAMWQEVCDRVAWRFTPEKWKEGIPGR